MTKYDTLADTLKARYSCRAFRADPVPDETITQIINAARHVPSWCNAQPWQVTVTKGDATERFREAMLSLAKKGTAPKPDLAWPSGYSGEYAARRLACGLQLYDAVGIKRSNHVARMKQMLRNYALFDAPHVAIIHSPAELGPYGAMDSGGFVTAFTLAATALGVATIPQAAIAGYAPQVRAHFDLPDDRLVLCAISFGYADEDAPINNFRTTRADPSNIIDWKS